MNDALNTMARWSPLMAMAWIATRDLAFTARFHPEHTHDGSMPTLLRLTVALAVRVRQDEADALGSGARAKDFDKEMGATAVESKLLASLGSGDIPSFGKAQNGSLPVPIPAHEWDGFAILESGGVGEPGSREPIYHDVRIDRAALQTRFPAPPPPSPRSQPATIKNPAEASDDDASIHLTPAEQDIRKAITELWPEGTEMPAKPAHRVDAINAHLLAKGYAVRVSAKTITGALTKLGHRKKGARRGPR